MRVPKSPISGRPPRNTPTIFNVSFNKSYYWRAPFTSLDQQLDDAIRELRLSWNQLIDKDKLNHTPNYVSLFNEVFPSSGISNFHEKQAIIAYEWSLNTPNSCFNQYLRGTPKALTPNEKKGYELFKPCGCPACRQGVNVGGNLAIDQAALYKTVWKFDSSDIPQRQNRLSLRHRGNIKKQSSQLAECVT